MSAPIWRNTATKYGIVTIAVHWLMAAAIVFMFWLGPTMAAMPAENPAQFVLFQLHKSIGLSLLFLAVSRILWRLTNTAPEYPEGMAAWERLTARRVHVLLYCFMIAVPVAGWATVSAAPLAVPTMWFGLFEIPHISVLSGLPRAEKRAIEPLLADGHGVLALVLASLVAVHAAAALKHHFLDRDAVLKRMLGWGK